MYFPTFTTLKINASTYFTPDSFYGRLKRVALAVPILLAKFATLQALPKSENPKVSSVFPTRD